MNKGLSFYFGYLEDTKLKAKKLKQIGFDCIMTSADPKFKFQDGSIGRQVRIIKKNKLKLSSLHFRYSGKDLPEFWRDNEIGSQMEKNLITDIKVAAKYGFKCVVVHLRGEEASQIGFDRLDRILMIAREKNIPLAIENIEPNVCFFETMKRYKDEPLIRFCYDSGHNHSFDPDFDYLTVYRDKLICLHLHDNLGDVDAHTLNKFGNTNWDEIAKKLAKVDEDINLDYEILFSKKNMSKTWNTNYTIYKEAFKLTCWETAAIIYKQACELEDMILKYKSKSNKK